MPDLPVPSLLPRVVAPATSDGTSLGRCQILAACHSTFCVTLRGVATRTLVPYWSRPRRRCQDVLLPSIACLRRCSTATRKSPVLAGLDVLHQCQATPHGLRHKQPNPPGNTTKRPCRMRRHQVRMRACRVLDTAMPNRARLATYTLSVRSIRCNETRPRHFHTSQRALTFAAAAHIVIHVPNACLPLYGPHPNVPVCRPATAIRYTLLLASVHIPRHTNA